MPIIELDFFEYANDAAAQAAYPTTEEYGPNEFSPGLNTWGDGIAAGNSDAGVLIDGQVTCPPWVYYYWTLPGSYFATIDLGPGNAVIARRLGLAVYPDGNAMKNFELYGSNNTTNGEDGDWTLLKSGTTAQSAGLQYFEFNNSVAYRYYKIIPLSRHGGGNGTCTLIEIEVYITSLQCYSENSIKQQGSYSLKGIAKSTYSLNEYIERTLGTPIDLSGKGVIKFDIRSNRTGQNIKISIRDSGGVWTEITPNIASADTWQTIDWNISGVSDANKDAINRIKITVVNADVDNTFYIDNMYSPVGGPAVISGGGTLVGTGKKSGIGAPMISGGGALVATATKESAGEAILSGGGSLIVTGEKFEPAFYFEANLIGDFEYIENIDEVKNHIIIEGEEYSESDKFFKTISGDNMLDKSIEDRHIKEVVSDLPYETQALVSLNKDVMVPFYLPTTMLKLYYVKLNLYFPGFQDGDYPDNSNIVYIPHFQTQCKTLRATNGTLDLDFYEPKCIAGNSVGGGNYYWHRYFFKFDISPYFGFKLIAAELRWVLENKYFYGSGANTQISMILDAVSDFGILRRSHWSLSSVQSFGVANQYTDSSSMEYSMYMKPFIQQCLDNRFNFVCFRMKGQSEPTDAINAINYRTAGHTMALQLAEDTDAAVSIYADNGSGFGSVIGSYSTDQEDIDLTSHFSGAGRKRLKFTCQKIRRIDILIRIGLTIDRA